jgi:hypothetical protein
MAKESKLLIQSIQLQVKEDPKVYTVLIPI